MTWQRLSRWLSPYLRPYWTPLGFAAVGAIGGAVLGLMPPLIARHLVDDVLVPRRLDALWPLVGLGFAISAASVALGAAAGWVHARATAQVLAAVRRDVLLHVLALPPATRAGLKPGDVVQRLLQDVAEAQRAVVDVGLGTLTALLTGLGALAWLVALEWRLAVVCVTVAPMLAFATARLRPWTLESARQIRTLGGETMALLGESLAGATQVQAHAMQGAVGERFMAQQGRFLDALMRERLRAGVARAVPATILGLVAVAILGWGGARVVAGELTTGALLAFSAYVWRFFGPLRGLAGLGLRLQGARASLERVEALQALVPVPAGGGAPPPAGPYDVAVEGLTVRYGDGPVVRLGESPAVRVDDGPALRDAGRPAALDGVTLRFAPGVATALVGPSGAGKSTLLLTLLGLVPGLGGVVRVNGVDLADLDIRAWRRTVAWVSPDAPLVHGTVRENLALWAPAATEAAMAEALALVGLAGVTLDAVVGERGGRLSGGQRQRLAIAGALVRDAELLLLDEATGALDPAAEAAIWQAIAERRRGRTTILVTHRPELAALADATVPLPVRCR